MALLLDIMSSDQNEPSRDPVIMNKDIEQYVGIGNFDFDVVFRHIKTPYSGNGGLTSASPWNQSDFRAQASSQTILNISESTTTHRVLEPVHLVYACS